MSPSDTGSTASPDPGGDLTPDAGSTASPDSGGKSIPGPPRRSGRPMLERLGMAAIALVLVGLFGLVAVAAFVGGEIFLAAMGALGALMTLWVGIMTLLRG